MKSKNKTQAVAVEELVPLESELPKEEEVVSPNVTEESTSVEESVTESVEEGALSPEAVGEGNLGEDSPAEEDQEAVEVETPVEVVPEEAPIMVEIVSVDGRNMEVSINSNYWSGKKILVPADQEGQVRKILTDGGYYIK